MKMFEAKFGTIVLRYYLMMAVVVGAFFFDLPFLAILAIPIFLSAMMGVSLKAGKVFNEEKHFIDQKQIVEKAA